MTETENLTAQAESLGITVDKRWSLETLRTKIEDAQSAGKPKAPGRYRLDQKSYIPRTPGADPELINAGEEIVYDGVPGPHMEPLDAAARAATEKRGPQTLDVTASLVRIGGEAGQRSGD